MKVLTILLIVYLQYCVGRGVDKRQLLPTLTPILCDNGPGPLNTSITTSGKAQQNVVYVDTAHPITCEGRVETVEVCFTIDDSRVGGFFFQLVSLRPQRNGYIVQYTLDIEPVLDEDETTASLLDCQNVTLMNRFPVRVGDLVGVRVVNSVEVAFAMFSYEGELSSVRVEERLGAEWVSLGLEEGELRADRTNDYELPMLRTFIVADPDPDDMDGSGSTTTEPAPVSCPTAGPGGNGANVPIEGGNIPGLGFDNIYNITYSAFVIGFIVSTVIAVFLFFTVVGMGMSMCPGSRKFLERLCSNKKKKQLKHNNFQQLSPSMELSIQ